MFVHNNVSIARSWSEKWLEFTDLVINEIYSQQPLLWSLKPPSDIDELNYLRLRFWLFDHEDQFLPLWNKFVRYGGIETFSFLRNQDNFDEDIITHIVTTENPFQCFYEVPNIYDFATYLGATIGINNNQPIHNKADWRLSLNITLGTATLFCESWLDMCDYWLCGN